MTKCSGSLSAFSALHGDSTAFEMSTRCGMFHELPFELLSTVGIRVSSAFPAR